MSTLTSRVFPSFPDILGIGKPLGAIVKPARWAPYDRYKWSYGAPINRVKSPQLPIYKAIYRAENNSTYNWIRGPPCATETVAALCAQCELRW